MRRYLLPIVAVVALLGWSRPVQAQMDLDSSMTALCVDATCSEVMFSLDVVGSVFIETLSLQSLNSTLWRFGGLVAVFSGGTEITGWTASVAGTPTGVTFFSDTAFPGSSSPLVFKVAMDAASTGTQADLVGLITYDGTAHADPLAFPPDNLSFGGTVTPEPSTYVMLATGLLGLMVAARRKRAGEFVQGEDA